MEIHIIHAFDAENGTFLDRRGICHNFAANSGERITTTKKH